MASSPVVALANTGPVLAVFVVILALRHLAAPSIVVAQPTALLAVARCIWRAHHEVRAAPDEPMVEAFVGNTGLAGIGGHARQAFLCPGSTVLSSQKNEHSLCVTVALAGPGWTLTIEINAALGW